MKTVDELVLQWKASGSYAPRAPRPSTEREELFAFCQQSYGFRPAADYIRFLELCDGGQIDAAWFFGCAPDTVCHLEDWPDFAIGDSGNVDVYVLLADGRAEVRGLGYPGTAFASFTSFTAMLEHFLEQLPPRNNPG